VLVRLDETKARTTLFGLRGQYWDAVAAEARLLAERDCAAAITFQGVLLQSQAPAAERVFAAQQKIFEARRSLLKTKTDLYRLRIAEVNEEIGGYTAQEAAATRRIAFAQEEIGDLRQLLDKGLAQKPRLLQLQPNHADIQGRRGDLIAQIAKAKQTIAENEVNILNL
jgi:HlyD family secretion protein